MHRAVLLASGDEIDADAIRPPDGSTIRPIAASPDGQPIAENMVGRTVAQVEQDLILKTLDHCIGNRTHAANILGISIRTLRNKLKQYTDEGVAVSAPGSERRSA